MLLLAIDPGATGGIAVVDLANGRPVTVRMPDTTDGIYETINGVSRLHTSIHAVVEDVGRHVQGNSAMRSATFAWHCGEIKMCLVALAIPYEYVTPKEWMKVVGPLPKMPPKAAMADWTAEEVRKEKARVKIARKNTIKAFVQNRYPSVKVRLWNADALGILTWAMERQNVQT